MADNPTVYAGTAGSAIPVAGDEVTIYGGAAVLQGVKLHDGVEGGTTGAKVTADGLYVFQSNLGTVVQSTTPWVTAGTVAVSSLPGIAGTVSVANQGTVVGTVAFSNTTIAVTQSTSPWVTAGTVTATPSGTASTKEVRAATSSVAGVAGTVTGVTVLASNANRLGAAVYNASTAILYLYFGASATVTTNLYSVQMPAAAYYETPFNYTGVLSGVWSANNGSALVTEVSA